MGPGALAVIHLNDSRAGRASRQDRHEHLGDGRIGAESLGHLVRHPRLVGVPFLLETPDMEAGWDALDLARVRAYLSLERAVSRPFVASHVVPAMGDGGARTHIPGSAPEPA
jgi:hypothetical protein